MSFGIVITSMPATAVAYRTLTNVLPRPVARTQTFRTPAAKSSGSTDATAAFWVSIATMSVTSRVEPSAIVATTANRWRLPIPSIDNRGG